MASSSGRRSGSSGSSSSRKRVAIGAEETVRVRYKQGTPQVESERKPTSRQSQRSKSERAGGRVPKPSGAGHRVASQKRDERDRRRKEIGRRRMFFGALLAGVVLLLAWGLAALWQAPLFKVEVVKVTGVSHLKNAEVIALADVPSDATLLKLPAGTIAERVQSSPWVASVDVSRQFPDTLNITVHERVPVVRGRPLLASGLVSTTSASTPLDSPRRSRRLMRVPTRARLPGRSRVHQSLVSFSSTSRISNLPPVLAFTPRKRAGTTRESLSTSTSSGRRYSIMSLNRRCSSRRPSRCRSSSRD